MAETLIIQLHADSTYYANPLPSLLQEVGIPGAGAEFWLFDWDPDPAACRAEVAGWYILELPTDKAHGLRKYFLLDLEGYSWVPGRVIV
ncbi:MAG: hypothetical protein CMM73_02905 [Rhodospirillaceae bacterium]|nr:hypothetical protein [Rhodospirillaceae bacterium]